jgi:dipeptidyl aminopeptidase/acylaminoacyl peptidase
MRIVSILLLLICGLFAGHSLVAQTTDKSREIPLKDFFDNPKISGAAISPDGKRLAFLSPENNRLNIWVCDTGSDLASAKAVTHDTKRGIITYAWTRDSSYILFEQDQGGDENFHLYRTDPSNPNAKAVDLTPSEGARAQIIDLPRDRPNAALVAINARDKRYFDAYEIDIASGRSRLLEKNPGDVDAWFADGHGIIRACAAQLGTTTEIRVRDLGSGLFRLLATYSDEESASIHGFGPDGSFLYISSARGSNTERLVTLDLKTGKETVIDEDPEYDLSEVLISDQTNELLGVGYDRERLTYKAFEKQFARDLSALEMVHDGEIHFRSSTRDEKRWVIAYDSPNDPGATYLYDRETGQAQFLYRPRPWLPRDALADVKSITFQSRDGLAIHGYLTVPKGVEARNLPTVLVVHGGPWARDNWGYDPETQFLANRGFAVLQINYRGSTGYGKRFLHAGDREWGGKMLDDLVDGAEWAVSQGFADRGRLAIYGGSYGGYATLAALAFRPKIFACGIDYVGISNLLTFMNTIPPYWETFRDIMYKRVGDPKADREFLLSRSPLFAVDKIEAPLLVAQGYNDPRVNHAEAEQIVDALKAKGSPVEYLVKMDEGHGFQNPENRMEFYERMEAFLKSHLNNFSRPTKRRRSSTSP